jgi:GNAT superfamily N-acetyltransferase
VSELSTVEPLDSSHLTDDFDCGKTELNEYLIKHALPNQGAGGARTYVVHRDLVVAGYHSLAAGAVTHEDATERAKKGMGGYDIPVILLARLAVDINEQGAGLGAALLKDALLRSAQAADTIGARAVLVHAMDEEAASFYDHFNFEPSPTDPLHMLLLMKDLREWLESIQSAS